ncbi:MAG: hypothetical protein ACRC4W_04680 [Treponemataceae bacterium]
MHNSIHHNGLLAKAKGFRSQKAPSSQVFFTPSTTSEKIEKLGTGKKIISFFENLSLLTENAHIKKAGLFIQTQQLVFPLSSKGFSAKQVKKLNQLPPEWSPFFLATQKKQWTNQKKSDIAVFDALFSFDDYDNFDLEYFTFCIDSVECCFFLVLNDQTYRDSVCTNNLVSNIVYQTENILNIFSFKGMVSFYAQDFLARIDYAFSAQKQAFSFTILLDSFYKSLSIKISPADTENLLTIFACHVFNFIGENNIVFLAMHKIEVVVFSSEFFEMDLLHSFFYTTLQKLIDEPHLLVIEFTKIQQYSQKDQILKIFPHFV